MKKYLQNEEENNKIVNYANEIINHQFSFDKTWDMERCVKKYQLPKNIDWNQIHNEDEEWVFMLNRFSYLKDLALAYLITEKPKYLDEAKELIIQWINAHPTIEYSLSTRTLDTGIRIELFVTITQFLEENKLLSMYEKNKIISSIFLQVKYLRENYITKYRLSNWGSIQLLTLLYIIPQIDPNYKINEIYLWVKEEAKKQIEIQIYPDGMHWEQSTMYHVEVLNTLLRMIQINKKNLIEIDEIYIKIAYEMTDALYGLTLPQGNIETFGDSDRVTTHDIFIKACSILNTNRWKKNKWRVEAETIFDLGEALVRRYNQLDINEELPLNFDGVDSGIFVTKSSNSKDASSTMFLNGSLGSGHGHCDNLHVSFSMEGIPFLIDNGRYTYREDSQDRIRLKSMNSHNVLVIDEKPHSIANGSWSNKAFCRPTKTYYRHVDKFHTYESGVTVLSEGSSIFRKLIVIDRNIWVFADEIFYSGKHQAKSYYHFDPEVQVNENLLLKSGDKYLKMEVDGNYIIKEDECSLRYNEMSKQKVVEVKHQFENYLLTVTEFVENGIKMEDVEIKQGDNLCTDSSLFYAKKFIVNEKESYVVIIFHQEVFKGSKIFSYEDCSFHAKSLVIEIKDGINRPHVLKY